MSRGRFITVEGIEGVGKTTQMQRIADYLQARGHDVVVTREPGGTPAAESIRDIVLNSADPLPAYTEMLLMFAARSANVTSLIRPALQAGQWVLCDRFTDATMAYQGFGRGISLDDILTLAELVHGDVWPDLTLLLDAPVETGLKRAAQRSEPDRFESEKLEFFQKVREGYLELAQDARVRVIDARQGIEQVSSAIDEVLDEFLQEHGHR